jgi:hypothetical protein
VFYRGHETLNVAPLFGILSGRVNSHMWERDALQRALLGQPICGDPLQIAFHAAHIDRRQLALGRSEPKPRAGGRRFFRILKLPFLPKSRRSHA